MAELGASDPAFRLRAGNPQDRLYDECHREFAHAGAKSDQEPRPFSERRGGSQTDLPGLAKYHAGLVNAALALGVKSGFGAIHKAPVAHSPAPTPLDQLPAMQ